jgi:hypothetical protein
LDRLGHEGYSVEWAVYPFPQVATGKPIPPEKCNQVGQGPPKLGSKLQVFNEQHGYECCPNLCVRRILSGADKCFDPQVLLQRFEKELDLPSILVNR